MSKRYIVEDDMIYDTLEDKYIRINDITLIEDACEILNMIHGGN